MISSSTPRIAQLLTLLTLVCMGCNSYDSPVAVPGFDPDSATRQAMELYDTDRDEFLSPSELEKAPGLKAASPSIDTDDDQLITYSALRDRIAYYRKDKLAMIPYSCTVLANERPLAGVQVKFVPESFLADTIDEATGTTDKYGFVMLKTKGQELPGVQVGMYRIEIVAPDGSVPAQYNTATTLGLELADDVPGIERDGVIKLDLRKN